MQITVPIQMVDLGRQYQRIKEEIDEAVLNVVSSTRYIKGPVVDAFEKELADYLGVRHVISCANGTDALQIALMACDLKQGDEVIVPAFTYVATAEVIGLLKLHPVMIDVNPDDFNVTAELIEQAITEKTRAIVPVHLFGQPAPMKEIMEIADQHHLMVIEDNAQAIGSDYFSANDQTFKSGTIGHIGCTSFFPSKNLGCFGDGGAMFTDDDELAGRLRMISNHGQVERYYHDMLGVNSRLDAIQAAVLRIKLKHLDDYCSRRRQVADQYDEIFKDEERIKTPVRIDFGSHVFHQYTLQVPPSDRDALQSYLADKQIPSMIYYPVPLYKQKAFEAWWIDKEQVLPVTEKLCDSVISLPIHTEMEEDLIQYIGQSVVEYFQP